MRLFRRQTCIQAGRLLAARAGRIAGSCKSRKDCRLLQEQARGWFLRPPSLRSNSVSLLVVLPVALLVGRLAWSALTNNVPLFTLS
jgi:hypothetical protein